MKKYILVTIQHRDGDNCYSKQEVFENETGKDNKTFAVEFYEKVYEEKADKHDVIWYDEECRTLEIKNVQELTEEEFKVLDKYL